MSTEKDTKKRIAKSKQAFDQKTYDNVGLRYKRGIKNIVGYIAAEKGITLSDIYRIALEEYIKKTTGKNIMRDIESDIDMLLRVVHRPVMGDIRPYVYKKDFNELLELRNRAEINCFEQTISEEKFKERFKDSNSLVDIASRALARDDEWYWTDKNIFDVLYLLVYQANKKWLYRHIVTFDLY